MANFRVHLLPGGPLAGASTICFSVSATVLRLVRRAQASKEWIVLSPKEMPAARGLVALGLGTITGNGAFHLKSGVTL